MKVLYISNYRSNRNRSGKRLNPLRRIKRAFSGSPIGGQDGFFAASLYTVFDVTGRTFEWFKKNAHHINRSYDAVLVNQRIGYDNSIVHKEDLSFIRHLTVTKGLVVTNAEAGILPPDDVLDLFDVVFKREHYIDLDRYRISESNKAKIRNTMLGCPFIDVTTRNVRRIVPGNLGYSNPSEEFCHDLFFAGKTTHPSRLASLQRLYSEGFDMGGGLTPHRKYGEPVPGELKARRVSIGRFAEIMRGSRINLAIEGKGEYTFRHNEALFLCTFMISSPSVRGLKLPLPIVENTHYVCFEDLDDLVDKVRYFLSHDSERRKIAQAGRNLFAKEYSFQKHGEYIRKSLQG
ncbi:MAG: glycosyltransferase [Kiritimatiellia bacterium]